MLRAQSGFTLMEMVVSLVVLGLMSVVMLPLLTMPANSYMDAQRRVELHQQMALIRSKLSDDVKLAMPGSLRQTCVGANCFLEYLEVRATARYRKASGGAAFCAAACGGNVLTPACANENCATTLGPAHLAVAGVSPVVNVDYVAVPGSGNGNLPLPYTLAPAGTLTRLTNWTPRANDVGLRFQNKTFAPAPAGWTSDRLYLISQPVTYACNTTTGRLTKFWGYAIAPTGVQPTAFGANVNNAILSDLVTRCLPPSVVTQGLRQTVSWRITLARNVAGQPVESVESLIQLGVREP